MQVATTTSPPAALAKTAPNGPLRGASRREVGAVARTTLVEQAVERLLDAIREGTFGPGEKLPSEHELAAQLGLSRTATREALQRLAGLDVIQPRHGYGYVVGTLDAALAVRPEVLMLSSGPDELWQLLEARTALEKELAVLAARRATADDLATLRQELAGIAAAQHAARPPTEHDVAFHLAVARAARNPFLLRLSDVIAAYLQTMRARLREWPYDRRDVLTRHQAIYDAIAAGDPEAAAVAMQHHMDMVAGQFQVLRSQLEPGRGGRELA